MCPHTISQKKISVSLLLNTHSPNVDIYIQIPTIPGSKKNILKTNFLHTNFKRRNRNGKICYIDYGILFVFISLNSHNQQ